MLCLCHVELNSRINLTKHNRSTVSESNCWINFGIAITSKFNKICHATRPWHDSDSNIMLLPHPVNFVNYIINVFWGDSVPGGSYESCYMASGNPEFGATLALCLNQSDISAMLLLIITVIKFGRAEARLLNCTSTVKTFLIPAT